MKKKTWEQFSEYCHYIEPCDCGSEMLCNHPDSEERICIKESCPIIKENNE